MQLYGDDAVTTHFLRNFLRRLKRLLKGALAVLVYGFNIANYFDFKVLQDNSS